MWLGRFPPLVSLCSSCRRSQIQHRSSELISVKIEWWPRGPERPAWLSVAVLSYSLYGGSIDSERCEWSRSQRETWGAEEEYCRREEERRRWSCDRSVWMDCNWLRWHLLGNRWTSVTRPERSAHSWRCSLDERLSLDWENEFEHWNNSKHNDRHTPQRWTTMTPINQTWWRMNESCNRTRATRCTEWHPKWSTGVSSSRNTVWEDWRDSFQRNRRNKICVEVIDERRSDSWECCQSHRWAEESTTSIESFLVEQLRVEIVKRTWNLNFTMWSKDFHRNQYHLVSLSARKRKGHAMQRLTSRSNIDNKWTNEQFSLSRSLPRQTALPSTCCPSFSSLIIVSLLLPSHRFQRSSRRSPRCLSLTFLFFDCSSALTFVMTNFCWSLFFSEQTHRGNDILAPPLVGDEEEALRKVERARERDRNIDVHFFDWVNLNSSKGIVLIPCDTIEKEMFRCRREQRDGKLNPLLVMPLPFSSSLSDGERRNSMPSKSIRRR